MNTTAEQMRAWTGPAILSYGFRPFFLGAGLWAGVAMLLWIAMLAGWLSLPTAFDPVSWHAHEFLFGYLGAVSAGFLLTAVPNWTGRLPIVGWPLGGLFALWLLGRAAIGISAVLSPLVVALADLGFPVVLAAVLAREIVAGRNWRNLVVLAMFGILILGNALFHWEAARGDYAAGGAGLRIGLSAGIVMITVIGGRIVPSFTRNWLARQGRPERPAPGDAFDRLVVVCTVAVLLVWVIAPSGRGTALALIFVGILQFWRLGRWSGLHTLSEPLVWSLHVGYGFIPLGALVLGVATLWSEMSIVTAAQHLWMAGAIGGMTLAVMSRATLGHTGQPLSAGTGTTALYLGLMAAVLLRFGAGLSPGSAIWVSSLAGGLWAATFLGFAVLYSPAICKSNKSR